MQKLGRQRHLFGHAALSASICFLAVRIVSQQKEIDRVREESKQRIEALQQENDMLRKISGPFREAVQQGSSSERGDSYPRSGSSLLETEGQATVGDSGDSPGRYGARDEPSPGAAVKRRFIV